MATALLRLVVPFLAFVVLAKAETCGCKDDKNGPVCHPIKLDYIAECAAQADCNGEEHNYVACASLRAVSWRHDCSCRISWDPLCDGKGGYAAPNWECNECLKLEASYNCKESNMTTPKLEKRDCQCPEKFQDQQERVCSTVTGRWIAHDSCEAYCRGFKSFLPCSQMPNRKALIPATGLEDKHIENRTCSMVGAKIGDIAGNLGCQKVLQMCRAAGWNSKSAGLGGWESGLVVLPSCSSEEARDCYEAATDWALKDKECTEVLSQDGRLREAECSAATARRMFAGAVSRVCGEEEQDGKSPFVS